MARAYRGRRLRRARAKSHLHSVRIGISEVGRLARDARSGSARLRAGPHTAVALRLPVRGDRPEEKRMTGGKPKVVVVMPAYNAAKTLHMTYADLPHEMVDLVILVDDGSKDETARIAKELGLELFVHDKNYGYGANQKTCYREALKAGADIIVMV